MAQPNTTTTSRPGISKAESLIADGFRKVPCPECGKDLDVGDKEQGTSGAQGYRYSCKGRGCTVQGFALVSNRNVLLKLAQGRVFQIVATAITSFSIAGLIAALQASPAEAAWDPQGLVASLRSELERETPSIEYTTGSAETVFPRVERDVLRAKKTIDIISFGDLHEKADLRHTRTFLGNLIAKASDEGVHLRRLLWKPEHLPVADAWSPMLGSSPTIEIRYVNGEAFGDTPFMPCVIIDGQDPAIDSACVHFGLGYLGEQTDTTVRDGQFIAGFQNYFDRIWNDPRTIPIKQADRPVSDEAIEWARADHTKQALDTLLGHHLPKLRDLRDYLSQAFQGTFLNVELLPDYDSFRAAIAEELDRTKHRWWITRVQSRQTTPALEEDYFKAYEERLSRSELHDVRRLVTVPTREHLLHYERLLDSLGRSSQFSMKVWSGPGPPSTFDVLLGDDTVILAFGPGSSNGPPTWGLRVRNPRMAQAFAEYYEHVWLQERHCVVIKESGTLDPGQIERAKQTLRDHLR